MNIKRFSLKREYEISCKLSAPEHENVRSVIVGVHGFAGDKESSALEKLAEEVCQRNTALICFDFPAHGDSPADETMLTVENCKRDLLAVVKYASQLYPEAEISIFATSFGGYIALQCADELKDCSFVLRAPAVTMPRVLLENVLKITADEFRKEGKVRCGFEWSIELPYAFYEDLLSQEDLCRKRISSRAFVIHGDCDDIVPVAHVERFARLQDNITLQIINGADHRFKNAGELDRIVDLTVKFLKI